MEFLSPATLAEALEMKAAHPDAVPIAGGTDVMVELNFDTRRPSALLDLTRVAELTSWERINGDIRLGAGVPYSRIIDELGTALPGLAMASRTVGSPQIRNRGTVGGNVGTASPAGDALPVLAAYDAEILLVRRGGQTRAVRWDRFMIGPKKTTLAPDELILGARWQVTRGPGSFSKVGPRNAMVIAVAGLCLAVDEERRAVRVALGSVGPTILRAPAAERFAAHALTDAGTWDDPATPLPAASVQEFAERVAAAAQPIDDVRGTTAYRRHACMVLARRALSWAISDRRERSAGK